MRYAVSLICLVLALAAPPWAAAQAPGPVTLTFDGFPDLSAFTLNGSAAETNKGGKGVEQNGKAVLRLTESREWQGGSAFLTRTIALTNLASFSAAFQFEIHDPKGMGDGDGIGADGLAFVVQTKASNVGASGGGVGYQGIAPSVAVEFDTFDNGEGSGNHAGISLNGDTNSVVKAPIEKRLNDGGVRYAWVDYDGARHTLEVRFADEDKRPPEPLLRHEVDLAKVFGEPDVFVGFTASTGQAFNVHDIRYLQFINEYRAAGAGQTAVEAPPAPPPAPAPAARLDVVLLDDGTLLFGRLVSLDAEAMELQQVGEVKRVPRPRVHSLVHAFAPKADAAGLAAPEGLAYVDPADPEATTRDIPPPAPPAPPAPPPPAGKDVLQLSDGAVWLGKLVGIDAASVRFRVGEELRVLPRHRWHCAVLGGP